MSSERRRAAVWFVVATIAFVALHPRLGVIDSYAEAHLASALVAVVGFGLVRDLAANAKPDITTYAAFFAATLAYVRGGLPGRLAALVVWSALIPLEMVAIGVAPGILLGELVVLGVAEFIGTRWREALVGGAAWAVAFGAIVRFNLATIGSVAAGSHAKPTVGAIAHEGVRFVVDTVRTAIIDWYGSIRDKTILLPVAIVLLLGMLALASVRPSKEGRSLRAMWFGVFAFA
jgi:hypothetical protein